MIQLPVRRGLGLAAPIVLFAAAVAVGATYRVRYLERALLDQHGDRYGVVISDLRMPNVSGIELHDHVELTQPALLRRFVFGTGDVSSEEAARFVQRTTCHVLQKPFELRMLDEVLAQIGRSERP